MAIAYWGSTSEQMITFPSLSTPRSFWRACAPCSGAAAATRNIQPHDVAIGCLRLDGTILDASIDGLALHLTAAEFRLLEMLMRAPRRALSRVFLSERVLGRKLFPNDRSIDTHISNLRRKLASQKSVGIEIRGIRGTGYMLTGHGEIQP